jgi:hypothetical protein
MARYLLAQESGGERDDIEILDRRVVGSADFPYPLLDQPLSTREKGVLAGGVFSAGGGGIFGSAVGAPGAGAAFGALDSVRAGCSATQEAAQSQTRQQLEQNRRALEQQRQGIHRRKCSDAGRASDTT